MCQHLFPLTVALVATVSAHTLSFAPRAHADTTMTVDHEGDAFFVDKRKDGTVADCWALAHAADGAMHNGAYARAVTGYTKIIEWSEKNCGRTVEDPVLWEYYKSRAEAKTRLGDFMNAASDIALVMHGAFAAHKYSDDDIAWMTQALNGALRLDPENTTFHGTLADLFGAQATAADIDNDSDRSRQFNLMALEARNAQVEFARSDKERAAALADRHFVHKGLNDLKRAHDDITKAIELDPQADYYWRRAFFNKGQGDLVAVIEGLGDISKAIEKEPERHWYYKLRTEIYLAMGNTSGAIDSLTGAMAAFPADSRFHREQLRDRARLFKDQERFSEATADYAELIDAQPKDAVLRSEHMLVLLELGHDEQAKSERIVISGLDETALQTRPFVCAAADIYERRNQGKPVEKKDTHRVWNSGAVVAAVPIWHVIGKASDKHRQAWTALSRFVAKSGDETTLEPVPEFEGSNAVRLQQGIKFIFDTGKTVKKAVTHRMDERAGHLFALSLAGHLTSALNKLGVQSYNLQLAALIAEHGPQSGLPCETWANTMLAANSKAESPKVAAAWDEAVKAFKAD